MLQKIRGGLSLPNLRNYYWASQLRALLLWIKQDSDIKWMHVEQSSIPNILLSDLPFLNVKMWKESKIQNEWIIRTLNVWVKVRKKAEFTPVPFKSNKNSLNM